MKSFKENRLLYLAIGLSLMAHGALLAVHFVAPKPAPVQATDPGLEVILVNAKHSKAPLKADALAQANLDGGGTVDKGRSKSPLPDMRKMETGDSIKAAKRRIAELEEKQRNLLTQAAKQIPFTAPPVTEKTKPDPLSTGADLLESSKAIARRVAEISETIEDQNKRPKKTLITPSTREVGYANYYKTMQKRIEDIGTLNFPQQNGRKLYGQLMLSIPVFQDGTIYDKEGIKVERSSGNAALDEAAIRIVRRSAPFGKFPPNMLSNDRDDLWVIVTTFKFTREDKLQADLSGGGR
ncbi:TonB family protein [Rugamonas sp. FT81W]|uniref:TonB family protein n=2 Tax=Duganella vulcania TaxID=2692166 RepID=A0A845GH97_9BURK|nr:TonB family protein [Duganella vulcania]